MGCCGLESIVSLSSETPESAEKLAKDLADYFNTSYAVYLLDGKFYVEETDKALDNGYRITNILY